MERAFVVPPGATRGESTLRVFGTVIDVLLSSRDSNGQMNVIKSHTPPQGGPPLHRHSREDEFFYIQEGRFRFEVDGETIEAGPGCAVYAARGTVHTFQNIGETTATMITVTQPGGLADYFTEVQQAAGGGAPDPVVLLPISERYGLEILGPPMAKRAQLASK